MGEKEKRVEETAAAAPPGEAAAAAPDAAGGSSTTPRTWYGQFAPGLYTPDVASLRQVFEKADNNGGGEKDKEGEAAVEHDADAEGETTHRLVIK